MENYIFTMRFEDDVNSLSAEVGLSIEKLGELLISLSKAVGLKEEPLTLSKISGNCYALDLSTNKLPIYENLRSIHDRISENDYSSLNSDQIKYATKLNLILGDKYRMNVYDPQKTFNIKISKGITPLKVEIYYEIDDVYGIIASIGGRSIESQPCIKLSGFNYEIFVTSTQESKLLRFFKNQRIFFKLRKKIDFNSNRIISAELIEYEVIKGSSENLANRVDKFLSQRKGKPLFSKVKDSANSVRELRGNIDINLLSDDCDEKHF